MQGECKGTKHFPAYLIVYSDRDSTKLSAQRNKSPWKDCERRTTSSNTALQPYRAQNQLSAVITNWNTQSWNTHRRYTKQFYLFIYCTFVWNCYNSSGLALYSGWFPRILVCLFRYDARFIHIMHFHSE